jgi:hypothetical protein
MSIPFGSNVLTFSAVAKQLRMTFETFTDRRRGKNTRYTLVDAALSAFSVFFMQSPSFLEHQRTLQDTQGKNNTFLCLLGLLLARVIEHEARRLGYRQGLSGLLELLGTIRSAMVLQTALTQGKRPRCTW